MTTALDHHERRRQITRVLVITLLLNVLVALGKLAYGYASGTISVLADGFHSLMDGTSNVIGLVAIRFAYDPPDQEHRYGHRKAEILAALMIAVLLAITCLEILKELLTRVFNPVLPEIGAGGFVLLLVGLLVNLFVVWYEVRAGKRLKSHLLLSDAEHTRSDLLVTVSVLCSMGAITQGWYVLDYLVSLGIAVVIGRMAWHLFREIIDILMDRSPVDCGDIQQQVQSYSGVINCHKVRAHGSPDEVFVDLHIWVAPDLRVDEAHALSHEVKKALMQTRPELADVTIHIEPAPEQTA